MKNLAREWLRREDRVARRDRLARLQWLAERIPNAGIAVFHGGWVAKYLFEECRYCFVYGQFMAVVVLGLAFIERTLAALFYAAGRDDLERASIFDLLREAHDRRLLSNDEFQRLDEVRMLRNPVTHFRAPLAPDTVEARALRAAQPPYSLLEADAEKVMEAVLHIHARHTV
jgi:hypothetical protein